MNDKVKGIIAASAVLVLLGGTLGVLKLTDKDKPKADSSSVSSSAEAHDHDHEDGNGEVKLVDKEQKDVSSVAVKNQNGSFVCENAKIKELDGLALDTDAVNDITENAAALTAAKTAEENASDLKKYGLEKPQAQFSAKFSDDSEVTFLIGDSSNDERYNYVCQKGEKDVYMVLSSVLEPYMKRTEDFVSKKILDSLDSDTTFDFGKMTVSRKALDYDMVFEQDDGSFEKSRDNMPSQQVMTEPIFSYLNGTTSTSMLYGFFGLTAQSVEVVFPDEKALKKYGLDKPETVVTFKGKDYDYTLNIGKSFHETTGDGEEQTDVSGYYCTFKGAEGKDAIFKIDASALPYTELEPGDVIASMMTWNMITDVSEIKIGGSDIKADFKLKTKGEGEEADISGVTENGKDIDITEFKNFYEYLISCPTDGITFDEPKGKPFMTMDIVCTSHTDSLEFFKDTDRRLIVRLNKEVSYRIQSKWADRMIENAELVRSGKKVIGDY